MKTIFIEFFSCTPHVGQSFELAQTELDKGNEVEYYFLGDSVPFAEFSQGLVHPILKRAGFNSATQRLANLVEGEHFSYFEPELDITRHRLPKISCLDELKQLTYRAFNVGLGITSSLISYLKEPSPDLQHYQALIADMYDSAAAVYEFSLTLLEKQCAENTQVFLMNGRFCCYRAVFQVITELGLHFKIHEGGCDSRHYTLYPSRPHDLVTNQKYMMEAWSTLSDKVEAREIAHEFFAKNRKGIGEIGYIERFSKNQIEGNLPRLPSDKKILAFFTSTEDEYEGLFDLITHRHWDNQFQLFEVLTQFVNDNLDYHLVIRVHPHMKKSSPKLLERWRSFFDTLLNKTASVTIIDESSDCSSYSLIDAADKVLTYGSQTGIEAVYFGKPSIMLGPVAWYSEFDCIEKPKTKAELVSLLTRDNITPNKESSLPYAYYMATRGELMSYYDHNAKEGPSFRGNEIHSSDPRVARLNRNLFKWLPVGRESFYKQKTLIFGFSKHGLDYALLHQSSRQIIGFLDNNKEKQKTKELGLSVFAPEVVSHIDFDLIVIIGNRAGEMYKQLRELGVNKEKLIFHHPIVQLY